MTTVYKEQKIGGLLNQIEEIENNAANLPEWLLSETNKKYNQLKEKLAWQRKMNKTYSTGA